jgi:putative solute:sodium symporter small subunit
VRREYWRKYLTITALALVCWLVLTVLVGYFARHLATQAALILYVVLIGLYAWYVKKQDRTYGARQGEE